jgi:hypothetical protein
MSDIATRVKKIIVDKLGVDEAEVTSEASFTNDLGAENLIFLFPTNKPKPLQLWDRQSHT